MKTPSAGFLAFLDPSDSFKIFVSDIPYIDAFDGLSRRCPYAYGSVLIEDRSVISEIRVQTQQHETYMQESPDLHSLYVSVLGMTD